MAPRLNDCTQGDVVALVWPHGSDYCVGEFGDPALRGTEQLVVYGGPIGGDKKGKVRATHAIVQVVDQETLAPIPFAHRVIHDAEVLEVVSAWRPRALAGARAATDADGDQDDPLLRRRPSQGGGINGP